MTTILFIAGGLIIILFLVVLLWLCGIHTKINEIIIEISHLKDEQKQQDHYNETLLKSLELKHDWYSFGELTYTFVSTKKSKIDILVDYLGLEFNTIESKPETLEIKKKEKKKL